MLYCSSCHLAKCGQLPFSNSQTVVTHPFQLVCVDLWDPSPYLSWLGFKYYLFFVDKFTPYMWFYPIKLKSGVHNIFLQFLSHVERLFNTKLQILQIDGGGEFTPLTKICKQLGINHRLSCPHTHQKNGLVERKHRHIVKIGFALLAYSSLPLHYWAEAFETAAHLINLLPTCP